MNQQVVDRLKHQALETLKGSYWYQSIQRQAKDASDAELYDLEASLELVLLDMQENAVKPFVVTGSINTMNTKEI